MQLTIKGLAFALIVGEQIPIRKTGAWSVPHSPGPPSRQQIPNPSPLTPAVLGLPQPPPCHFDALPCVGGPSAPRPSRAPPHAYAITRRLPPSLPSTGRGSARTGWPCGYPRRRLFAAGPGAPPNSRSPTRSPHRRRALAPWPAPFPARVHNRVRAHHICAQAHHSLYRWTFLRACRNSFPTIPDRRPVGRMLLPPTSWPRLGLTDVRLNNDFRV